MTPGPRLRSGVAALCLAALVGPALETRAAALPASTRQEEHLLLIGPGGWSPSRIEAHRGIPLRFRIKAQGGEHCFALDAYRIERRIVVGRETTVDLVPDQVGSFVFYDCLAAEGKRASGRLVVSD